MWKLLKIELFKIFKRPRTYIAFGAIAAIVFLIQIALKYDGKSYIDLLLSNLSGSFEFDDEFKNKQSKSIIFIDNLIKKAKKLKEEREEYLKSEDFHTYTYLKSKHNSIIDAKVIY